MQVPSREETERLLREAEALNPGPWTRHSRNVGRAAELIAERHPALDAGVAHAMGSLHDIGRRFGPSTIRHVVDGYRFMNELGYPDVARICLTHSFPVADIRAYFGKWDSPEADRRFLRRFLIDVRFDDYDRLIQLCDALCVPEGFCLIEKRLIETALRHGLNESAVPKWRATFTIKETLEAAIGCGIYDLLPGVVEATFGREPGA